jgi:predicted membrane channel-forming protein YqfA (hemolysin III family)
MNPVVPMVTAASLLFGFLFAAFWWALNRELTFKPEDRHFKYSYALLLGTMGVVAILGILRPLRDLARTDPSVSSAYAGVAVAFVGVFGYMLTEFGHYSIYQKPKYVTRSELIAFWLTLVSMVGTGFAVLG